LRCNFLKKRCHDNSKRAAKWMGI